MNSYTDSSGTNCANMNLAMDSTRKMLTANYPYPNLQCTVNFYCDSDGTISPYIKVVSNEPKNSWP